MTGLITGLRLVVRFARFPTLMLVYLHMLFFALCLGPIGVDGWLIVRLVASVVAMTASYANATAINDLSDEATDAINLAGDPSRPLVSGQAGRRQVRRVAVSTGIGCVAVSALVGPWAVVAAAAMIGLNVIYSLPPTRVSGRGALAQLLLPLEYCAFPAALMALAWGRVSWTYAAVVVSMYVIFIGRVFLKDIRDEVGDRATGKRTFVVRHSKRAAIIQSGVWTVSGTVALSIAMYFGLDANPVFVFGFCAVSLAGQITALVQADRATDTAQAVLYTGVYSRWISMKVFFYVMLIVLARLQAELVVESVVLALMVIAIVANVLMLYDNLRRERVRLAARPSAVPDNR